VAVVCRRRKSRLGAGFLKSSGRGGQAHRSRAAPRWALVT
jgi:hypothetical protein